MAAARARHLKRQPGRCTWRRTSAGLSPGPVDWDENPERRPLDLTGTLAGGRCGWRSGSAAASIMVHQAALNPDKGLIGASPIINGVAMLLGKIRESAGVDNLRVHPGDARDLFDVLPDASVAKAFLLYPDPWPKTRHHRRRFVTPEHLGTAGARHEAGGGVPRGHRHSRLRAPDAARGAAHGFHLAGRGAGDWRQPWDDWLSTRYEQKALREGRVPHYLTFRPAQLSWARMGCGRRRGGCPRRGCLSPRREADPDPSPASKGEAAHVRPRRSDTDDRPQGAAAEGRGACARRQVDFAPQR
jgi:tRNA (guanine-N7-)-methyltransferase